MRTHVQRRDFLKLGAAGLTAAGAGSLLTAPGARAVSPTPAEDDFGYVQYALRCWRRLLTADARHLAGLAELGGGTAATSGLQGSDLPRAGRPRAGHLSELRELPERRRSMNPRNRLRRAA